MEFLVKNNTGWRSGWFFNLLGGVNNYSSIGH